MTKGQLLVIVNALCVVHIYIYIYIFPPPGIEQESAVLRCSQRESAAGLIHGFAHCGFPIRRRIVIPVHCDVVLLLVHGCACKVVIL